MKRSFTKRPVEANTRFGDKVTITFGSDFLDELFKTNLISTDATKTDVYYALLQLIEEHNQSNEPVTAAQERGTVETYRNRRNPNKYIEVKKGNDGHSYARQYLKWDTPNGEVKNYMGARTSRGRYFRHRRDSIDQMLEDYDAVECADNYLSLKYTFHFGDGKGAASRGFDAENDCVLSGSVSWDGFASAAVRVLNVLPDNFTDTDILDALSDYGYDAEEIEDAQSMSLEDMIDSLDITGGDPLIYKVEKNGQVIYYEPQLEEIVKSGELDYDV